MNNKASIYFLQALIGVTAIVLFFVLRPFLYTLILAVVFAVGFQSLHRKLLQIFKGRAGLAALTTTFVVVLVIFIPLIFIGFQIFKEAWQLYLTVTGDGNDVLLGAIQNFANNVVQSLPAPLQFSADVHGYLTQGLHWVIQNLDSFFSNVLAIVIDLFIFFVSLYYLLKEGLRLRSLLLDLSPLSDADDKKILKKLELSIGSVVRGSLVVALVQGTLAGIGFTIFGVPNPILWGSVTALAALIPGVGTSLVIIPMIVFLFFEGNTASAIGLLIWGSLAVGLIDNFLGPKLMGRGMQLHPFLVFLAVLGGIGFFGPIGFLLGPVTLSLFEALLEVYFGLKNKIA